MKVTEKRTLVKLIVLFLSKIAATKSQNISSQTFKKTDLVINSQMVYLFS